jgi:phosphoglycerate dehydrogenase-like enzyme
VKAVIVAGSGDGYADDLARRVEELGTRLVRVDPGDREGLQQELADADALLCNRLEPGGAAGARRLRLVQALSAGADGVDPSALPAGCALCNLFGHEQAIGEWVLMAMLACARRAVAYDRRLRAGDWAREVPLARELAGRTVGTVGWGHIGRRVAALAQAVGMDAVAVTRSPSAERSGALRWLGGLDELGRLLDEAHFAVVAVPLASETEGLIGAPELARLGPRGVLVNVARGPVVDERALYEALRDGTIAGAALDVWYRYPRGSSDPTQPSEFPFHELDNVLMSPHVSGTTVETELNRRAILLAQLERFAGGEALENVIAVG